MAAILSNLSLNCFIVPVKPSFKRNESFEKSVDLSFSHHRLLLERTNQLYFKKESKEILESIIITLSNELFDIKLVHETSYTGFPYQIVAKCKYENEVTLPQ
jgi:uncharacterized protein with PIN domain